MSEALAMLNEGVRLGDVSASDSLADALISTGDLDKAEAVLRTAMERAPADPRCRRRLASLLSREGKAAAAIRILLEGVKRGEPVDGEAVPVAEAALDSETALLLREIQGAANGDLDTFKGRVLAVADLGDALPDNERATRTSRRRAAAASDLLQALTEKQHEASDPSVAGNVAVLIAQAQQLLSDDTPPTPTAQ
jgi:tetratricopeptide (TPR) repeat protein